MENPTRLLRIFLLIGVLAPALLAAHPASAQYACPYGYYYSDQWGCVPAYSNLPYSTLPGFAYYPGYNDLGGAFFDFRGHRFDHHDRDGFHGHVGRH